MRLSMSGIGATLQDRDEMATIRELVPGSPTTLSGKLKVGDRIVGCGEARTRHPLMSWVGASMMSWLL